MKLKAEQSIYRDGVPVGRNTLKEIAGLRKNLTPEMAQRFFDQAIWDSWCRLHKEVIYWGA